jgi:hypothetical protein
VSRTRTKPGGALQPARWAVTLVVLAIVGAMASPIGAIAAQTPTATSGAGIISVVPDTALAFAQVNLDADSDQMVLARQLTERAGLGDPVEQLDAEGEFPENSLVGVAVTSIPEADNIDVASVSVDPTLATESLDEGGYAVIIKADNPQQVYDALLADVRDDADMGGGDLTESAYGGVTISSFAPSAEDDYSSPGAVALVGDYVVSAMNADDIHPIIDTFNGDTPDLSKNENYQKVNALLPAESISNGYFDGPAVLEAIEATAPGSVGTLSTRMSPVLSSWTGYALTAEQDGFRLVSKSVASEGAFDAITPVDGSFFDKVPSDAVFAINGQDIDGTGALTMLAFLFAGEFAGEDVMATPAANVDIAAMQDEVFAKAEQVLGFHLTTDLIDHLIGEFGLSVSVSDITAPEPSVSALIVSQVDDPQAVTGTMAKIALIVGAAIGDQTLVQDKDVNGSTVKSVDISDTGVAATVDFGVVGEDLVIAVGSGMDDYVNGAESPMSDDPNFNAVLDHLPDEHGSITYVNMPVLLDLVMSFSDSMEFDTTDADPSCGEYASQAEAQAAYDEDQFENYELDQDFDGEACEDYFGGTPAASPAAAANPYQNILGLGTVTTLDGDVYSSETFLLIGGE